MRGSETSGKNPCEEVADLRARVAKLERLSGNLAGPQHADEDLDKAWAEWGRTFDAARDSIMVLDGDFNIVQANLAASRLIGKPLEEIIGRTCWQVVHGTDSPPDECLVKVAQKTKNHEEAELYLPERDIWIEVSADPILDDQGDIDRVIHVIRDITERKKNEQGLREREERYRSIFNTAASLIVLVDPNGVVADCNSRVKDILGYEREEIAGQSIAKIIHPDDIERAKACLNEIFVHGSARDKKYRMIRKDKREIDVEVNAAGLKDGQDKYVSGICIIEDITERNQAQEAIAESEQKFRSIFDNANDVIVFVTTTGKILEVNRRIKDVLGYDRDELIGKNFITSGILAARNAAMIVKLFMESVTRGGFPDRQDGRDITEVWLNHKNGHTVLVEASTTATRRNGKLGGFLSILRDVTDRRKADEAYRSLVDHSLQGLVIFQDGRVVFANQAMAQITGYTVEEMLAASPEKVRAFVYPDDREMVWGRHRQRLQGELPPERYELRGVRKDGSIRWLEIDASPIEYQGRPAIQAAYVDITERKKAKEALQKSQEELKAIFESAVDGIIYADRKGHVVEVNPAFTKITGIPREQVVGRDPVSLARQFGKPKDLPQLLKAISDGLAGKPIRLPDLEINNRIVEILTPALTNGTAGITAVMRDVTERLKAQQSLQKERDKAQRYLDVAGVILVAIDSEQRVGLINKKGCEILGYEDEEILGKNWFDNFLPERVRDETRTIFEKFVKGQADAPEYVENPILTKSGQERLIAWHNTTLKDDQGSFVATLSSGEDITERRRAEEAMRQSEEKYRDLFENARQAIITFDTQGNITGVNKLIEEYGFKRGQFIGKPLFDFVAEDHRAKAVGDFETLISGHPVRGEMDVVTPKGTMTVEYRDNPIIQAGKVVGVQAILTDITERKKAEEMLRETNEYLENLINYANSPIIVWNPQFRITKFNHAFESLTGRRAGDVIGKSLEFLFPPAFAESTMKLIRKTLTGERWEVVEINIQHIDGSVRIVLWNSAVILALDGKTIIAIIAQGQDITDRKKTETELRSSEEKFRLAMDATNDALWDWNIVTNEVYRNPRHVTMLGYEPQELSSSQKEWEMRIHPDDKQKVSDAVNEHLKGKTQGIAIEYRLKTKSGDYIWVLGRGKVVAYNDDGKPIRMIGTNIDITERKKAEEQIEKLAKFHAENPYPIMRISGGGTVLFANPASAALLRDNDSGVGRPIPRHWQQVAQSALASGSVGRIEVKHGGCVLAFRAVPLTNAGYVNFYGTDITDRKKAEERLLEYQAKLRAMASEILRSEDRERRRLAAGLHGNICQKLVFSKLALESSLSMVSDAKLSASLRIASEAIGQTIEEADSLTLELSNPILREFGFLAALEKYLTEDIRQKHGIPCELESDKQVGALSDELKTCLFRVTRELLTNAVRHAHASKIKVSVRRSQGQIHVRVEDDGIGFKYTEVSSEVSKTTRFGLFSVREQLEYLGGRLDIESEPGRGTTATVVVPLAEKTVV